jgi:hypothetical protein
MANKEKQNVPEGAGFTYLTGSEFPEELEQIYGDTPCELFESLLNGTDGYRLYFNGRPKNELKDGRLWPNLEHDKANVWRDGLYVMAGKLKVKCPDLTDIPQPTGEPDLDITMLKQWLINAKKNLIPSSGEKAGEISPETAIAENLKTAKHSVDFRSVFWFGDEYSFTGNQAAAVKILWENWKNGTPDVSGEYIATEISSDSKRARDIFKEHPALGSMICQGQTKGTYRLTEPKK